MVRKQNLNSAFIAIFLILSVFAIIGAFYLFVIKNQPSFQTNPSNQSETRDFIFQIDNFPTKNQGGQTLNMYFHYRYNSGIKTSDIPDYRDLRNDVINYMNGLDISKEPYWETLSQTICQKLKAKYPIQAISCQLQVMGDNRAGLPNEPGTHSSITTIGNIEPLSIINELP